MLQAVEDGDLAAVQALLVQDMTLRWCTFTVRCRTARAGPSSELLWSRRIWWASLKSARSEDRSASAPA